MADYSINAVTRRVVYTGSAGVGPYAFSFEILAQTDIVVYKDTTKLTLTTDYTVTINSNGTGSVTLVSAATSGNRITILGQRAISRTTDFVTAGDLLASSLNDQLDSQIIMIQQLAEENRRTMKAPQYDPASAEDGGTLNMVLPVAATRASKSLAFDADGNPIAGPSVADILAAQTYATNAAASATAAAGSATSAAGSASSASSSASTANSASSSASTSATNAASSASSASTSASTASTAASNASTSATNAASSASSASTSATNAATSASSASTSATSASTANTAAQAAKTAAEAARDATLAAYDSFDDRYLGTKTSDPTVDNDGNALVAGALYYNTTVPEMRVYTGSAWASAYTAGGSPTFSSATVTNSFSVGIGSPSAGYQVEIKAATGVGASLLLTQTDATANAQLVVNGARQFQIGTGNASSGFANLWYVYDATAGATRMSIDSTGKFNVPGAAYQNIGTLTDAATVAVDMSLNNNFSVTLAGNRTLGNPTNLSPGQSGVIFITQDATGSRTLAFSSYWKFSNAAAPSLTAAANSVDALVYTVRSSTSITAQLITNVG